MNTQRPIRTIGTAVLQLLVLVFCLLGVAGFGTCGGWGISMLVGSVPSMLAHPDTAIPNALLVLAPSAVGLVLAWLAFKEAAKTWRKLSGSFSKDQP